MVFKNRWPHLTGDLGSVLFFTGDYRSSHRSTVSSLMGPGFFGSEISFSQNTCINDNVMGNWVLSNQQVQLNLVAQFLI